MLGSGAPPHPPGFHPVSLSLVGDEFPRSKRSLQYCVFCSCTYDSIMPVMSVLDFLFLLVPSTSSWQHTKTDVDVSIDKS